MGIYREGSGDFEGSGTQDVESLSKQRKSWKYYKMYLALEKTLSAEQTQVIEEWEKRNCMSDVRAAFRKFVAAAEAHFLGGRLIAKKEAKGRLAKWLRKNGLAVESRYGRENKIWP